MVRSLDIGSLSRITDAISRGEVSVESGLSTGGSQTTVVDTGKNWAVNMWADAIVEVTIGAVQYMRICSSNTATTLTIAALPAAVAVVGGCMYTCKFAVGTDVTLAAGTSVFGKARLVTATGDEVTDDTADAIKTKDTDGVYTTPVHAKVAIGATTTVALAANSDRLYALFVNDSDEAMYLELGDSAVQGEGIRINPAGGAYEMSKKQGNLYVGAVNAICASGSKNLLVTEGD